MRQMDRNQQLPVTQMRRSRMVVPGKRLPNKKLELSAFQLLGDQQLAAVLWVRCQLFESHCRGLT